METSSDFHSKFNTIAVVGAGTMGAGIAQTAAAAGHSVRLFDAQPEMAKKALTTIDNALKRLVEKGKIDAAHAAKILGRIQVVSDLKALSSSELVIEAIIEDLGIKQTLFRNLEACVSSDCILATNTSSLSITAIAAGLKYPGRVAGMHFFNPVPVMKLVEVVTGLETDRVVAEQLIALAESWEKKAVLVKSVPGFIVNRVARPFYAEALRVLSEGSARPETIDAVVRQSGGFRMGPFELMDLIGNDVNFAVTQSVYTAYFNDPRFLPSLIQRELVLAGFFGRKTGRGFYQYGQALPKPEVEQSCELPKYIEIAPDTPWFGRLKQLFPQAKVTTSERGLIAVTESGKIYQTDGRTATQRAAETGHRNLILVDLCLDSNATSLVALAKADQCELSAFHEAVGLFQKLECQIVRMDDLPGLIVARTVTMLINEASDVVYQKICDVASVDTAMVYGVNYPIGPLAWADRLGVEVVETILKNLANYYGEDRYRISPLIRRKKFTRTKYYDES